MVHQPQIPEMRPLWAACHCETPFRGGYGSACCKSMPFFGHVQLLKSPEIAKIQIVYPAKKHQTFEVFVRQFHHLWPLKRRLQFLCPTVDGSEILHQLRLVAHPHSLQGFFTSQVVVWDFFHQAYL